LKYSLGCIKGLCIMSSLLPLKSYKRQMIKTVIIWLD